MAATEAGPPARGRKADLAQLADTLACTKVFELTPEQQDIVSLQVRVPQWCLQAIACACARAGARVRGCV